MAYRIKSGELSGKRVEVPPEIAPDKPRDAQVAEQHWDTQNDAWSRRIASERARVDAEIASALEEDYLKGREANRHLPVHFTNDRPLLPDRMFSLSKIDATYPVMGLHALKVGDVVCRHIRKMEHGLIKIIDRNDKNRITAIWVEFNGKTCSYEPAELRRVHYVN